MNDEDYQNDAYRALCQEGGTYNGKPFNSIMDLLGGFMSPADRVIDSSSAKKLTQRERKIKKLKKKRNKR